MTSNSLDSENTRSCRDTYPGAPSKCPLERYQTQRTMSSCSRRSGTCQAEFLQSTLRQGLESKVSACEVIQETLIGERERTKGAKQAAIGAGQSHGQLGSDLLGV